MVYAEAVTTKKSERAAAKFEKILERMPQPPQNLNSDRG